MTDPKKPFLGCGAEGGDDKPVTGECPTPYVAPKVRIAQMEKELADHIASKNAFAKNAIDLQKRAVAAEQRNTELTELLRETLPALTLGASAFKSIKPTQLKVKAALKGAPHD